jgi:hypothetical protein
MRTPPQLSRPVRRARVPAPKTSRSARRYRAPSVCAGSMDCGSARIPRRSPSLCVARVLLGDRDTNARVNLRVEQLRGRIQCKRAGERHPARSKPAGNGDACGNASNDTSGGCSARAASAASFDALSSLRSRPGRSRCLRRRARCDRRQEERPLPLPLRQARLRVARDTRVGGSHHNPQGLTLRRRGRRERDDDK